MKKMKKQIVVQKMSAQTEKTTYGNTFWLLLLSMLLIAGSVITIVQSFGKQLPFSMIRLTGIVVISLIFCVLSTVLREQYSWAGWLKVVPWIGVLALTGFHGYWNGAKIWMNLLITQWNQAKEGGVALFRVSEDAGSSAAFLMLCLVLISEVVWILAEGNHVAFCYIFGLFWLLLQLMGEIYSSLSCGLLVLGILGIWMSGARRGNFRTSIRWMLFAVVTLCICLVLEPDSDLASVDRLRENTKQAVKELRYGKDSLPEGDLANAAKLQESSEEMLTVKTEQKKNLYFRGFVGGRYKDGCWEPLPDASYGGDNAGMLKWLKKHGFDPLTQVAEYYKLSGDDQSAENKIQVSVKDASRYYIYGPSSLSTIDDKRTEDNKDLRIKSRRLTGAKSYVLDEYSETRPAELIVTESWVSNPLTKEEKKYSEAEAVYRDFVYRTYTEPDENLREMIDDYFWSDYDSESDGIYSAITQIRKCLSSQTKYVEQPADVPEGKDPIEYFLLESQEGNSMAYTSAAVEALRVHGIPARYVEGYYLSDKAETDPASGEIAVTGQDAHAWMEVYFDGVGWLPLDVTPGYYYDAVELQQMVSSPDASKKNAALEDNASDANELSGNDGGKAARKEKVKKIVRNVSLLLLGVLAFFMIICAVFVCVLEGARIIYMQRFQRTLKTGAQHERMKRYNKAIYYLLALRGIEAQLGWNMPETDRKVTEIYEEIIAGEYIRVCELLEKEIYGEIELEPYEERTIKDFFDKISVAKKSDPIKLRLRLRYVYIALARC